MEPCCSILIGQIWSDIWYIHAIVNIFKEKKKPEKLWGLKFPLIILKKTICKDFILEIFIWNYQCFEISNWINIFILHSWSGILVCYFQSYLKFISNSTIFITMFQFDSNNAWIWKERNTVFIRISWKKKYFREL